MKQLFVPLSIIAGLIIFFNMTACNSFNCYEKETREGMPVPAAVPVATPKEAEKANEFAIFLSAVESTVVEGEIMERSELPDPLKSDYPDCRFTVHFKGNTIISGEPCPKELALIVDGFENYRILASNNIKAGDKIECSIIPYDRLPEDFRTIQQADDLELYLLENYYICSFKKIITFSEKDYFMPASGILFTDNEYISIFNRHINSDIPEDLKRTYNASIQEELEKVNRLLDGYKDERIKEINSKFNDEWKKEQMKDPSGYNRISSYVWRNIDNSFWALPRNYTILEKPTELSQYILDCFSSLKRVCESNGIHLIVSIVPNLYVISSRVINPAFRDIPDLQTAFCVKQLLERGIESFYVSDKIIQNYNKYPFAFFYPANNHPSDTTQDCISDILVKKLERYNIPKDLDPSLLSVKQESSRIYNIPSLYYFPANCDTGTFKTGDNYVCRHFYYNGLPMKNNKESNVMIIGNSFIKAPMDGSKDLAFPSIMMYKMHSSVDYSWASGKFGPFSDVLARMITDPNSYLKGKKVLIMQFGADHLLDAINNDVMLNFDEVDQDRLILNNKILKNRFFLQTNVNEEDKTNKDIWGEIANVEKTVLRIGESGELSFNLKIDKNPNGTSINSDKPILCVIRYTSSRTKLEHEKITGNLIVNDINKTIQCSNTHFFNLSYQLPAGTEELNIKIKGKEGTLFAIKDIQIWQ